MSEQQPDDDDVQGSAVPPSNPEPPHAPLSKPATSRPEPPANADPHVESTTIHIEIEGGPVGPPAPEPTALPLGEVVSADRPADTPSGADAAEDASPAAPLSVQGSDPGTDGAASTGPVVPTDAPTPAAWPPITDTDRMQREPVLSADAPRAPRAPASPADPQRRGTHLPHDQQSKQAMPQAPNDAKKAKAKPSATPRLGPAAPPSKPSAPGAAAPPTSRWQKPAGGAHDGKVEAAKLAKDAMGDARRGLREAQGVRQRASAGMDAVEKGARAVAAAKTGGASEKILKTKPGQIALRVVRTMLATSILLPVAMFLVLALLSIAIIASFTKQEGFSTDIEYILDTNHAMALEDPYIQAYQNAAATHEVPWTLLAGIGQVVSGNGRAVPSDVAQYGAVIDRSPQRGPLQTAGAAAGTSGKAAPPPGSEIALIGDSLVGGGVGRLTTLLDAYTVTPDYVNGRTIEQSTSVILGAFAQQTPVVVVQAGVNDVWNGVEEAVYRAQIADLLDAGAATSCVVWVNLQNFYASTYDLLDAPAQRFNAVLAEEAASRPWVSIADFASVSTAANLQSSDGLHPNPEGYRVWADTVMRTVLNCMPAPVNVGGPADASAPDTPVVEVPAPSVEQSTVQTNPLYGTYICKDKQCGPYPIMGGEANMPVGPLQIDPKVVRGLRDSRNPHDIRDAADIVAEFLAEKRDDLLETPLGDDYREWRSDPDVAAEMWAALLDFAPVVFPQVTLASQAVCRTGPLAGPQGAIVSWPFALDPLPTALVEYGGNDGSSQVAGIVVAGPGSVRAAATGTVVDVGQRTDGAFVLIAHDDGFSTRYERLDETQVEVGDVVDAGTEIATATTSLLFQTLVDGSTRNPRLYVADAVSLPAAGQDPQAGAPISDPQAGAAVAGPQDGTPVDRCTGLTREAPVASQVSTGSQAGQSTLVIPVAGVTASDLTDTWGAPRSGGRQHQGIDIIRPIGTPVLAAAAGTVKSNFSSGQPCNKPNAPAPRSIQIRGTDDNNYYYGHVDQIFVQANQQVAAGDIIGTVGETGNACHSTPHLHFSINEGRDNVMNPYPLLSGARSLSINDFAGFLDGSTLARLSSSAAISGAAAKVVGYAWLYGGLVADDPNAGMLSSVTDLQSNSPGGQALSAENPEVTAIIRQYFPQEQWDNAIRLANCESGLNPSSVSQPNGDAYASKDWGLFQLNDYWVIPRFLEQTGEDPQNVSRALDAHWNARVAAMLWAEAGWGKWTCAHPPTSKYPNLVGLVSMSPKMRDNGGASCRRDCFDYAWHEPGDGDTSAN